MNLDNQLGVDYRGHLLAVAEPPGTLRDTRTGARIPLQTTPALATDRTAATDVVLALLDLAPNQSRTLEHCPEDLPGSIRVETVGGFLEITNGALAVRIPRDHTTGSGPLAGVRVGERSWQGRSVVTGAGGPATTSSTISSLGPCLVQWETLMTWPGGATLRVQMRWAAGSDTIQVVEECDADTDDVWTWDPVWPESNRALCNGGGEWRGPMREVGALDTRTNASGVVGRMGHISYFNQCHFAWLGFASSDETFVGAFTGWGSAWQRRGHQWIDVMDDGTGGHQLRFPVKRGRRVWGLCLSTRAEAGVDTDTDRCLPNLRKTQHADLPLGKVLNWQLDGPLPAHEPTLIQRSDLDVFRKRLATDPTVASALDAAAATVKSDQPIAAALAVWRADRAAMREIGHYLAHWARTELAEIADGGYEKLIIFQGRQAKTIAYDLDVLWALDGIDEEDYRTIRKTVLAMAWMFADGDFCNPEDFWAHVDPDSGVTEKLAPHMGRSPVPPNFLAEFFTTTGVIAEWAAWHPQADAWRQWSLDVLDLFLEHWFLPDGTYREAVNYHTHCLNALLCQFYPLQVRGVRDYFTHPSVRGSYEHFLAIQMPVLHDQPLLPTGNERVLFGADGKDGYAPMPANGNSGGHGHEQQLRGDFSIGAAVYQRPDPELAGQCRHGWVQGGKPVLDDVHPMLTLLTLNPVIPPVMPAWESAHRQSLGLVSKAVTPQGAQLWSLFRAGSATNHMDFDQGGLHLAFAGQVLLGDHGYHTEDKDGLPAGAWPTHQHSTVTYAEDRNLSSGYTGVELAPEPLLVHCGEGFDWCVHRIINNNYRDATRFPYNHLIPASTTRHVRHYLFVKPDYFLVWDVFEEAHAPATFWLHPKEAVVQQTPNVFRAGTPGTPHLGIHFLQPVAPCVIENEAGGPLWSFAVKADQAELFLVLLAPQIDDRHIQTTYDKPRREIRVRGDGINDTIHLPQPGAPNELPVVIRQAPDHDCRGAACGDRDWTGIVGAPLAATAQRNDS